MLTKEQRQLLDEYCYWSICDVILDADSAIPAIKARSSGGTRRGEPEWLQHYNTTSRGIEGGPWGDTSQVVVTWTQLRNWARSVPAELVERIRAARRAEQAEAQRVYKWCRCHHGDPETARRCEESNKGDPTWGGRYHPTEEEDEDHLVIYFEQMDAAKELLKEALGLGEDPVGQLDLFDELIGGNA